MSPDRPSAEVIEAWIAGTLPSIEASQVEAYFEKNPQELPPDDLESTGILRLVKEITEPADSSDSALEELIKALKTRPLHPLDDNESSPVEEGAAGWLELLQATDDIELIGRLGDYDVLGVIAATGMGTVLKARDPELKRLVAIKVLSPVLAANATAHERFLREARAMAGLEQENILPVYEVHQSGIPWFAMRFVQGGTLEEALRTNCPLVKTSEFLESLAEQLARALRTAHEAGIIHRDVKPANILLSRDTRRVWLTDFGIARCIEDPGLTYGGAVPGTPRYMSPEQAAGKEVDERTDLFSLGSVLYHVASGQAPFEGSNSTAILNKVMAAEPKSVRALNPEIPSWMAGLIERLMSKDPAARPSNLCRELEEKQVPQKRGVMMISFLAATMLTMLGWMFFSKPNEQPHQPVAVAVAEIVPGEGITEVTNESGEIFSDLHSAIADSPPGATLTLRGRFVLDEPLISKPGGLDLRAAEGTIPVIEMTHGEIHGIHVRGNLSARHIHFLRSSPGRVCYTLTAEGADLIEVSDCRFTTPVTRAGVFVYGVASFSGTKTIVRNCAFHGKRNYCILLREHEKIAMPREVELIVENSFFQGSTGIFVRHGFQRPALTVSCHGVVMDGKRFLRFGKDHALGHTRLEMADCLLNCRYEHVLMEKAGDDTRAKYFVWTVSSSIFAPQGSLLHAISPQLRIREFSELSDALPGFSHSNSWVGNVFDLFGNLSPELVGPAVITFNRHRPR